MNGSEPRAIAAARSIGVGLVGSSERLPDGSITWRRGFDMWGGPVDDAGMFNGRCGEAVFLAALSAVTGDDQFLAPARDALRGVTKAMATGAALARLAGSVGLGLQGVGSMIYALTLAAHFLKDESILLEAMASMDHFDPQLILDDQRLDVSTGCAGMLLSLMPLVDLGSKPATALADCCVDVLIGRRAMDPHSGLRVWKTVADMPQTGYAHGSTGIAHALAEYARRVEHRQAREAVNEARRFEGDHYRPDYGDWTDIKGEPRTKLRSSWCHGAGGIGFERLAELRFSESTSDVVSCRNDLQSALMRVRQPNLPGGLSLCCGMAGRAELLLQASVVLRSREFYADAAVIGRQLLKAVTGCNFKPVIEQRVPHGEGLWQGLAGVGYTLLRLAEPSSLPCVLAFEPPAMYMRRASTIDAVASTGLQR